LKDRPARRRRPDPFGLEVTESWLQLAGGAVAGDQVADEVASRGGRVVSDIAEILFRTPGRYHSAAAC